MKIRGLTSDFSGVVGFSLNDLFLRVKFGFLLCNLPAKSSDLFYSFSYKKV